jgi:hypothetical protein
MGDTPQVSVGCFLMVVGTAVTGAMRDTGSSRLSHTTGDTQQVGVGVEE